MKERASSLQWFLVLIQFNHMYHDSHFTPSVICAHCLILREIRKCCAYIFEDFLKSFNVWDFEVFLFLGHYAAVQVKCDCSLLPSTNHCFCEEGRGWGNEWKRERC